MLIKDNILIKVSENDIKNDFVIPDGITIIGDMAFNNDEPFKSCKSLLKITIPSSITRIETLSFAYCVNLKEITFSGNLNEIGEEAFTSCNKLVTVTIPNSVIKIGPSAFSFCKKLESIVLPSYLKEIEEKTFYKCKALKSITLPNSIINIGLSAFAGCTSLKEILLPDNLETIGEKEFYDCKSLKKITIPDAVMKIEKETFYKCINLEQILIPNNMTYIGPSAFYKCIKLKKVIIPDSVQRICISAFASCESLESVVLPNEIIMLEDSIFTECKSLYNINIPNSVKKIGNNVFAYCESLKRIIVPNTVEEIGKSAFLCCKSLEKITLSNNITIINDFTFYYCKALKKITIPNNVLSIESFAFYNCTHLEELTLSDNLIKIGFHAFDSCTSLKEIRLPKSMILISESAFDGIKNLTLNIETSLVYIDKDLIHNLLDNEIHSLTIYNELIDFKKRVNDDYQLNIDDIRKRELLNIIKDELNQNDITNITNISYTKHKKIIDDILLQLNTNTSYNYREDLNTYLEKYIKKNKTKNALIQRSNTCIFSNKKLDDVIEELKIYEIKKLQNGSTYLDIFNYGQNMNEYPLYISSIFYDTVSKYSKNIKSKQIKQIFEQLTSISKKQNILKKLFFKFNDNNEIIINEELLQELNSSIDNEIIAVNEEMIILNKIKVLMTIFITKINEQINYLNNYQLIILDSLDSFTKSDELLKITAKDSKIQELNNIINSVAEKYGQVNLVISSNLIYINKLNNIKNILLPTLLSKVMTNDIISKDIKEVKETVEISRMLEEIILNQENINNTLESNFILEDKGKQFTKNNNEV